MSEGVSPPRPAQAAPEGSLARPFLVSVCLLAATTGVALYQETVSLRPWKVYQRRYLRERVARVQKDLESARSDLAAPAARASYEKARGALAAAETKIASPPLRPELERLRLELARQDRAFKQAQKEFQILRSRVQELEYRLSRSANESDRHELERLRSGSREVEKTAEEREARKKATAERLHALLEEVERPRRALATLTSRTQALESSLLSVRKESIGIRQVLVEEAERVDRCVSCHVAADGSRPPGDEQPFTAHPGAHIYLKHHSPERFGCTLCHQGQGRAVSSVAKAHGEIPFWSEPLLRDEWAQASCQRCHENVSALPGAARLARGAELLEKYGCFGCHKIAGYENRPRIGPPLTRVATKVSYAWLIRWLQDPRGTQPRSRMPNFGFGPGEAAAVADFLFSLTGEARTDEGAAEPRWDLLERGRALYGEARCSLCHASGDRGGTFAKAYAPDLSGAGSKLRRAWALSWLGDPRAYHPLSRMPRFRFAASEREALAEFLLGEGIVPEIESEKSASPERLPEESVERGRRLVEKFGCTGCHEIQGLERLKQIGPELKVTVAESKVGAELNTIGNKPLELFDFGNTKIPPTRKDYLLTKLASPRVFREGLRMPNFELTHDEREALATLLLGFSSREMPRRLVVAKPQASFDPGGPAGALIRDLQCLTCHRIRGVGGDYAPELSFEGSRARREWIEAFLKAPNPLRPLLQQMPKFHLNDEEARTLAEFVAVSLREPRFESAPQTTRGDPHEGLRLYRERGCGLCHQIGLEGGAVGPELTALRSRIQPAYLRQHLLDPRMAGPAGPEPRYAWTEEELGHMSAYLLSAGTRRD